jgi:hypothetical protein
MTLNRIFPVFWCVKMKFCLLSLSQWFKTNFRFLFVSRNDLKRYFACSLFHWYRPNSEGMIFHFILFCILRYIFYDQWNPYEKWLLSLYLFLTRGIEASRPAQKCGRSMKKKENSNIYVMYIVWPLYMRCSIAMLFTCVLVLSHPVVKGGRGHVWNTNRCKKQPDTGWAKTNKEDTCGRELARNSV